MSLLNHNEILALHAAVISAGCSARREPLLSSIHAGFVASLPHTGAPGDQILSDLVQLNAAGALADGSVPIVAWLRNAIALTGGRIEEAILKQTLARCESESLSAENTALRARIEELEARAAVRLPEVEVLEASVDVYHVLTFFNINLWLRFHITPRTKDRVCVPMHRCKVIARPDYINDDAVVFSNLLPRTGDDSFMAKDLNIDPVAPTIVFSSTQFIADGPGVVIMESHLRRTKDPISPSKNIELSFELRPVLMDQTIAMHAIMRQRRGGDTGQRGWIAEGAAWCAGLSSK